VLDNSGNTLSGAVTASGNDVKLTALGPLTATVTATGNAELTSTGNLNVSATANNLTTNSGGSSTLGATTLTGNLMVNSTGGPITQTPDTSVIVAGTAMLNASQGGQLAEVLLPNTGNKFTGAVTVKASRSVVVGANNSDIRQSQPIGALASLPSLSASRPVYEFKILKKTDQGDVIVQLELKGAAGDWQIPLPQYLQSWVNASGGDVKLLGPAGDPLPGVNILDNGRMLVIKSQPGQRLPSQVVIKSDQGQVIVQLLNSR
jgi:hypothetical protein